MLDVSRAAVATYLRSRRVAVREDPTNRSSTFDRNRVRADVLPALERALGPSALRAFARAADVAREDERYLEGEARRCARALLHVGEGGAITADARALRELAPALRRRLLRRAAAAVDVPLTARHVARMERALEQKGPVRVGLPRGVELVLAYGELRLGRPEASDSEPFEHRIDGPGLYRAGGCQVRMTLSTRPAGDDEIALDPSRLSLPLWWRSRRPGDRFRPRGGREKKLKAFLIDRKIPRSQRDRLPLLCDDAGRVLWVVGVCASDAAEEGSKAAKKWIVSLDASSSEARALDTGAGRVTGARKALRKASTRGLKKGKIT